MKNIRNSKHIGKYIRHSFLKSLWKTNLLLKQKYEQGTH